MQSRIQATSALTGQYNGSTYESRSSAIKDPAPELACGTQQQRGRSSVSASGQGKVQHDKMRPIAASLPRGSGLPSPALRHAFNRSSAFADQHTWIGSRITGSGSRPRPAQPLPNLRPQSPLLSHVSMLFAPCMGAVDSIQPVARTRKVLVTPDSKHRKRRDGSGKRQLTSQAAQNEAATFSSECTESTQVQSDGLPFQHQMVMHNGESLHAPPAVEPDQIKPSVSVLTTVSLLLGLQQLHGQHSMTEPELIGRERFITTTVITKLGMSPFDQWLIMLFADMPESLFPIFVKRLRMYAKERASTIQPTPSVQHAEPMSLHVRAVSSQSPATRSCSPTEGVSRMQQGLQGDTVQVAALHSFFIYQAAVSSEQEGVAQSRRARPPRNHLPVSHSYPLCI